MTLSQNLDWPYERDGNRFPSLRLRIEGVHDVGRVIATLARGNCEHAALAFEIGRELNKTKDGRATLAYLEGHGGPKLGPAPCEECHGGNHSECEELLYPNEPFDGSVCGCFEAGEIEHVPVPSGGER